KAIQIFFKLEIFQLVCAQHDLGSNIQVRYFVSFGNEGSCSGSTGVCFDHVNFPILNRKLYIDQSFYIKSSCNLLGIIFHCCYFQWCEIESRKHCIAVATMNSGRLDMFHYAHHMKIIAVKDRVDLRFLATIEEMIDQDLISGDMF